MSLPDTLLDTLVPWLGTASREEVEKYVRTAGGALRAQDEQYPQTVFEASWNSAFEEAEQAWAWRARQLLGPARALRVLNLLVSYDPSSVVQRIQQEVADFQPRFSEPPQALAKRLVATIENGAYFATVELADDVRVYAQSIASLGADAAGYIGERAASLQLQLDAALARDEYVPYTHVLEVLPEVRELTAMLTFLPEAEVAAYNETRDILELTTFTSLVTTAAQCARMILARKDLPAGQVVSEVLIRRMLEAFLVNLEAERQAKSDAIELPEGFYERMVDFGALRDGTFAAELRSFLVSATSQQVDLLVELAVASPEFVTLLAPSDPSGVMQQMLHAKPGTAASREVRERVLARYEEASLKQQVAAILEILEILAAYVRS